MHRRLVLVSALAAPLIAAGLGAGLSETAPQPAAPTSNAPVPYALTMGDMMNTLIQPRHTKLGLAAQAENWALANYALVEIRQAFAGIIKAQPRFRGMPVTELVEAAMSRPLDALDAAIKQQDKQKFVSAYDQLTQGCNACHTSLNHPYVVIKTPDASVFPNQDFGTRH